MKTSKVGALHVCSVEETEPPEWVPYMSALEETEPLEWVPTPLLYGGDNL